MYVNKIKNRGPIVAFFDVDGVLKEYSPQGLPAKFDEEAIDGLSRLKENETIIGYASGKCGEYLIDCALLSGTLYPNSIIIGENGGVICFNGNKIIFDRGMDDIYRARRLLERYEEREGVYMIPDIRDRRLRYEIMEEEKESMITLLFDPKHSRPIGYTIYDMLGDFLGLSLSFGDSYVDINQRGCDKGYAIKRVCDLLEVPLDYVSAVGDSNNDAPMLSLVGYPACPSNSKDEIKEMVRRRNGYVAKHPIGRGTAEICLEYLLRNSKE